MGAIIYDKMHSDIKALAAGSFCAEVRSLFGYVRSGYTEITIVVMQLMV